MIVTGFIWPGWPVLPVLMLSAGFVTLASVVLPAAHRAREDTADAPGANERPSEAMGGQRMSDWRDKVRRGLATALPGARGRRSGRGLGPGPIQEAGVGSYILLAIGVCVVWAMWRRTDIVTIGVCAVVGAVFAFELLASVWRRFRGSLPSERDRFADYGPLVFPTVCLVAMLVMFQFARVVLEIRGDPDREIEAVSINGETGP